MPIIDNFTCFIPSPMTNDITSPAFVRHCAKQGTPRSVRRKWSRNKKHEINRAKFVLSKLTLPSWSDRPPWGWCRRHRHRWTRWRIRCRTSWLGIRGRTTVPDTRKCRKRGRLVRMRWVDGDGKTSTDETRRYYFYGSVWRHGGVWGENQPPPTTTYSRYMFWILRG